MAKIPDDIVRHILDTARIEEESKTKDWLYDGLMVTDADIPTDDEIEDTMRMLKEMNNRKQI